MQRKLFINILFSLFIFLIGGTPALAKAVSAPTVELTSPVHFVTPSGEDVEVEPGIYQVEAAEDWLKLVAQGESRTTSILIEAIRGPHEENISEPLVRTISNPETPDVLHLAFLTPDGVGMEAVGTVTGIRPRGLNFAFVGRTGKTKTHSASKGMTAPRPGSQTQAPAPRPTGQPVDCGPYQKIIGKSVRHSPALVVFRNALHLVTSNSEAPLKGLKKLTPSMSVQMRDVSPLKHWIFSNGQWNAGRDIEDQMSKTHVALANYRDRIHMVHLGVRSNDLWYSTYDGSRWTPNVKIPGQKSKAAPSLAVWNNQLHMVHLGDSSNAIWHSINRGNGWTVNVRIPGRSSDKVPALGRIPNGPYSGRLHMVYKSDANIEPQSLWHAQYDGRQWQRSAMIRGALTKAAPTLVSGYPDQLHLIHLGKSSNDLWHMLFGPNKTKNNTVEWFDIKQLLSERANNPVDVVLFNGCYHMVANKGGQLVHTTFSTPQIHPNVN